MSIVRIGLSENKGFSAGYDTIFGKKKKGAPEKVAAKPEKPAAKAVKPVAKKKAVKKK